MGKIFRFLSSRTSYALRVTSPLTTEQCVQSGKPVRSARGYTAHRARTPPFGASMASRSSHCALDLVSNASQSSKNSSGKSCAVLTSASAPSKDRSNASRSPSRRYFRFLRSICTRRGTSPTRVLNGAKTLGSSASGIMESSSCRRSSRVLRVGDDWDTAVSAPSAPGGGVPGAASVFSPSATFVVSEDASSSRADDDDAASPSSVAASEASSERSSSPGRRSSRLRTSALGFGTMGFLRPKRAAMGLGGRRRVDVSGLGHGASGSIDTVVVDELE